MYLNANPHKTEITPAFPSRAVLYFLFNLLAERGDHYLHSERCIWTRRKYRQCRADHSYVEKAMWSTLVNGVMKTIFRNTEEI